MMMMIFIYKDGDIFFLKTNEAWSIAPNLGHESMVLKNFETNFFANNDASDDFLKTNGLGILECPSLIKNSF